MDRVVCRIFRGSRKEGVIPSPEIALFSCTFCESKDAWSYQDSSVPRTGQRVPSHEHGIPAMPSLHHNLSFHEWYFLSDVSMVKVSQWQRAEIYYHSWEAPALYVLLIFQG